MQSESENHNALTASGGVAGCLDLARAVVRETIFLVSSTTPASSTTREERVHQVFRQEQYHK